MFGYRREIDGLRALAVVPVILFHAGFEAFSGGFVGVDVFFVISGYLITSIILTQKAAGTFSLLNFYERRARRILPALFLVMAVCIPFAWLWLLPSDMKDFSQSLVAVSVFASNILFWRESGYFDTAAELKPLLHTWSLAVEEQYYVLFPLFLLVMWRFAKRWTVATLAVIAALSFALAQWGAYNKPVATFFLLPTRGWEIAIGALIAFYFARYPKLQLQRPAQEVGGLIGLSLILYAVFAYSKETPFPSAYALAPTLGTALIILCTTPSTLVGRVLTTKAFVGVGLISYSAYLWHQPLFAFARHFSSDDLSVVVYFLLILLTTILAYVSWQFVEQKIRRDSGITRPHIFAISALLSLLFLLLGYVGYKNDGFQSRFYITNSIYDSIKRTDRSKECFDKEGVHKNSDWFCVLGEKGKPIEFVVFGDSHALSVLTTFDDVAKKIGVSGAFVGASGCTPLLGIYALRSDQKIKNCNALNHRVYEFVKQKKISKVFFVARWTYYTDGGYTGKNFSYISRSADGRRNKRESREAFAGGLEQTLSAYAALPSKIFFLTQVPQQKEDPLNIYSRAFRFKDIPVAQLSVKKSEHLELQAYVRGLFHSNLANVIDLDDVFCEAQYCAVGTNDLSYYFDDDHLSIEGARLVEKKIIDAFVR